MQLQKNERIEDLQCNGLQIIQNKSLYTFTSDSVVLANFISTKKNDKCVEIGSGSGVISLLLSQKTQFEQITAFEIQKEMFDLLERNIELNNLKDKIKPVNDDIKNYKKYISQGSVDVVFSNPPYMKEDTLNSNVVKAIARHEKYLPIDELCTCAFQMLKAGGRIFIVYGAKRTTDLLVSLSKHKLEPKKMFFTENGKGQVVLCVVEAVKLGKSGVEVLPNLVTNDQDGKYIELLHTKYIK